MSGFDDEPVFERVVDTRSSRAKYLEERLDASLEQDRNKKKRISSLGDGTFVVSISNRSVGLAMALAEETGRTYESILDEKNT